MLTEAEKRALLRATAEKHGLRIFVETGTYEGDTLAALVSEPSPFHRLFSVELSEPHYTRARKRFESMPDCVEIGFGNSGAWLEVLVPKLYGPALFWLDAHPGEPGTAGKYGECPLRRELLAIFGQPPAFDHVVLVDDARLFREQGWPRLKEIREIAKGWHVELADDVVRITRSPQNATARDICTHCGDPACWLGNECQGRVRSRYEFERAARSKATRDT